MESFVYCFKLGEYVKIGRSLDYKKRLRQIQTSLPHDLVPLYVIRTFDAELLEAELHSELSAHRVKREWFTHVAEIDNAFISRNADILVSAKELKKSVKKSLSTKYSQATRQDLTDTQFNTVVSDCSRNGYELFDDELVWLKKVIKKSVMSGNAGSSRPATYVSFLIDMHDNGHGYIESKKKTAHLDYKWKSPHRSEYYHDSIFYLRGILVSNWGYDYGSWILEFYDVLQSDDNVGKVKAKNLLIRLIDMARRKSNPASIADYIQKTVGYKTTF